MRADNRARFECHQPLASLQSSASWAVFLVSQSPVCSLPSRTSPQSPRSPASTAPQSDSLPNYPVRGPLVLLPVWLVTLQRLPSDAGRAVSQDQSVMRFVANSLHASNEYEMHIVSSLCPTTFSPPLTRHKECLTLKHPRPPALASPRQSRPPLSSDCCPRPRCGATQPDSKG